MVAELNAELHWGQVPSYVGRSFKSGMARRLRLPPGMLIFTLSNYRVVSSGAGDEVPYFWSPYLPFMGDPGYNGRLELCSSQKLTRAKVFRAMSASADSTEGGGRFAVVAKTRVPVWAFFGQIRSQGGSGTSATARGNIFNPRRTGATRVTAGYQFYIPRLTDPEIIQRVKAHDLIVS